jgi:hypothetical protein
MNFHKLKDDFESLNLLKQSLAAAKRLKFAPI